MKGASIAEGRSAWTLNNTPKSTTVGGTPKVSSSGKIGNLILEPMDGQAEKIVGYNINPKTEQLTPITKYGNYKVVPGQQAAGKTFNYGNIENATTVTRQAAGLSRQFGKNSISIKTPNKVFHYDLQGATHKGVPTPHVQQSLPNINPKTGQVFWNKDRLWVRPMNQQDIRIIRNYLNRQ